MEPDPGLVLFIEGEVPVPNLRFDLYLTPPT
jgi:hypothetical protein